VTKTDEFKSSTTDGVFVSRAQRRAADATAKAEVAANALAAEAQADAQDLAAYESEVGWAAKSPAEQTHLREQAALSATDEARKNNGLDTSESRVADAKKAADDLAAQQKTAAKAAKA
jgi:hypothetical protein